MNHLSVESTGETGAYEARPPPETALSVRGSSVGTVGDRAMFGVFGVGLAAARQFLCWSHERCGIRA